MEGVTTFLENAFAKADGVEETAKYVSETFTKRQSHLLQFTYTIYFNPQLNALIAANKQLVLYSKCLLLRTTITVMITR